MGTWSEFMPLGGKHIKDKSGKKNVTLKKSVSGKSVLGRLEAGGYQKQLSGKNLFDEKAYPLESGWVSSTDGGRWDVGTSTTYASTKNYIPFDKYVGQTITLNNIPSGNSPGMAFYDTAKSYIGGGKGNAIIVPTNTAYMRFTVPFNATNTQIEIGSTSTEFEEFCGGTASPNPEYPQTIHSTGDSGWFDGEWVQGYCLNSGVVTKNTYCAYSKNSIPCKENDEITLKYEGVLSATTASSIITFYDENGVYLSQVRATAEWTGKLNATAPTGATNFKFDLRNNVNDIIPDLTAKTTVTINGQYAVIIDEVGKNIFPPLKQSDIFGTYNTPPTVTDGVITGGWAYNFPIPSGKNRVFSFKLKHTNTTDVSMPVLKTVIGGVSADYLIDTKTEYVNSGTYQVSVPDNAEGLRFDFGNYKNTRVIYDMQIEYGVATEYAPYQHNRTYIPISEPLRAVNDVKDEIYVQNGEYGVLRRLLGYVVVSTDVFQSRTLNSGKYRVGVTGTKGLIKQPTSNNTKSVIKSSHYQNVSAEDTWYCREGLSVTSDGGLAIYDKNYDTSDISLYKSWLDSNLVEVVAERIEPTFEPFADQTPFYNLLSYDNVTNVAIVGLHENVEPTLQMFYPSSEDGVNVLSLFGNNSQLRFNDETGTIQVIDTDGDWVDIYVTDSIPIIAWDGSVLGNTLKFPASKWNIVNYTASGETSGGATLELSTQYLKLDRGSGVNYQSVLYLPVNVTNCKTLHITGHSVRLGSYYNVGDAWIQKVVPDGSKLNGGAGDIQSCRWNTGTAWIDPTSFTLDVSDLTGIYYICISNAGYEGYTEITELYFDLL